MVAGTGGKMGQRRSSNGAWSVGWFMRGFGTALCACPNCRTLKVVHGEQFPWGNAAIWPESTDLAETDIGRPDPEFFHCPKCSNPARDIFYRGDESDRPAESDGSPPRDLGESPKCDGILLSPDEFDGMCED